MKNVGAHDHCEHCGLTGLVALRAEQDMGQYAHPIIYRHSVCKHIIMYRSGGSRPPRAHQLVRIGDKLVQVPE